MGMLHQLTQDEIIFSKHVMKRFPARIISKFRRKNNELLRKAGQRWCQLGFVMSTPWHWRATISPPKNRRMDEMVPRGSFSRKLSTCSLAHSQHSLICSFTMLLTLLNKNFTAKILNQNQSTFNFRRDNMERFFLIYRRTENQIIVGTVHLKIQFNYCKQPFVCCFDNNKHMFQKNFIKLKQRVYFILNSYPLHIMIIGLLIINVVSTLGLIPRKFFKNDYDTFLFFCHQCIYLLTEVSLNSV